MQLNAKSCMYFFTNHAHAGLACGKKQKFLIFFVQPTTSIDSYLNKRYHRAVKKKIQNTVRKI